MDVKVMATNNDIDDNMLSISSLYEKESQT